MNLQDPTDISNVSIEGVTERLNFSRAAERAADVERKKAARPPPPPPAPAKPSKAEVVADREAAEYEERQTTLDKIGKYRDRFPKLKKRNGTLTIRSSMVELYDELHFIEQQLGKDEGPNGSLKPGNLCFVACMHGIEMSTVHWNPLNLKLAGLGQTVQTSIKQFEPLLDEFMIKHALDIAASVELRIIMMVATTVATVHIANTQGPREVTEDKDL
jgi:hypothetical protein